MVKKKIICAMLVLLCLSGCAFPPAETEPAVTEPPRTVGVLYGTDPAELTGSRLYERTADGTMSPVLAAAAPEDVTAEYAGRYGIPADAKRGYAFQISLNSDACWEGGAPITAADFVRSLETQLKNGGADWYCLAGARRFAEGALTGGSQIVSLDEAGFASVADAQAAGYREFYLDAGTFWALEAQWTPVDDTARLRDWAMPGGLNEQFVSGAYLYETYLAAGTEYEYLQTEFVGIAADARQVTMEDVGLLQKDERTITVILEEPSTIEAVTLRMAEFFLTDERSYGPYRVVSVTEAYTELLPNENWWGQRAYDVDILRIR